MYIDLDVHHGDGVQRIFWDDPGTLTVSIHETGHALFPGTGFSDEVGGPGARGTKVNVPLDPGTGEIGWLAAVRAVLPVLAERFRPEIVVSQHGCDAHAFDPLAHLNVTTTAMGAAARLVDELAHRWAGGRWLATGGGGYEIYRVVPRAWALVWLAGAHAEVPGRLPEAWHVRWAGEAERAWGVELPGTFEDPPNAGLPYGSRQAEADGRAAGIAAAALAAVDPAS
jgi:acetoin utilization protein AcuC